MQLLPRPLTRGIQMQTPSPCGVCRQGGGGAPSQFLSRKWGGGGHWRKRGGDGEKKGKLGVNGGEMEEKGGRDGEKRGEWGGIVKTGGKWRKVGGNGELAGVAHGAVGRGGLWRDVVEENRRKTGQKWEKNGTRYPFFTVPFSPLFRRSKIFPTVPFVKAQPTALTDGKTGTFATRRHPPPRRPAQRRAPSTGTPRRGSASLRRCRRRGGGTCAGPGPRR